MLFWEINSQCSVREKKREGELEGGSRGHIFLPITTHTYTLRRIYGRLRVAIDKIVCLLDLLFNSRGKVLLTNNSLLCVIFKGTM